MKSPKIQVIKDNNLVGCEKCLDVFPMFGKKILAMTQIIGF